MAEQRKLVQKLAEVMKEVKYIQKRGYNSFHKYKYATEADVAEKVREALAERNIVMIPSLTNHSIREHTTSKGNREYITTVVMEFRFIDGETGETITFSMIGEGQDAGDKGPYKAMTGAQKYALMKTFMIPTGDDPEADEDVDKRNNEEQKDHQQDSAGSKMSVLKAKWQKLAGSLNGFEEWYKGQKQSGYTDQQMDVYLTKKMQEKGVK
jgi:ERF superfamily